MQEPDDLLIKRQHVNSYFEFAFADKMIRRMNKDAWFMILQNVFHNGHGTEHPDLRKPSRLHSTEDLHLVRSAMQIYAGEGVARALYYHRTGEVLDRSALQRLKTIQEDSTLELGSAAEALLNDLR